MRLKRIALGFGMATLVATVAAAQKITTESSPDASFASYKTYMWLKQPNVGDPIMKQHIVDNMAQLQGKDLRPVQDGADVAVAAHMATRTEKTLNTFYNGFGGGWRWGGGFGSATTMVNTYQEGDSCRRLVRCQDEAGDLASDSDPARVEQSTEPGQEHRQGGAENLEKFPPSERQPTPSAKARCDECG